MKTQFLFSLVLLLFIVSCKKDDNIDENNGANGKTTAVFNPNLTYGSLTDQDGNVYKTIKIGSQTWMAENLRTTKYNDGNDIKLITDESTWLNEWKSYKDGAYCNYSNTKNIDTIATYGRLYNAYTLNNGKLAPKGWHVSTKEDWNTLKSFIGYTEVDKMKEEGDKHWKGQSPGTNETGFTALAGGRRNNYGFESIDFKANWWIYTLESDTICPSAQIHADYSGFFISNEDKNVGLSVRCVKDN